jgi:hypothetical protein
MPRGNHILDRHNGLFNQAAGFSRMVFSQVPHKVVIFQVPLITSLLVRLKSSSFWLPGRSRQIIRQMA